MPPAPEPQPRATNPVRHAQNASPRGRASPARTNDGTETGEPGHGTGGGQPRGIPHLLLKRPRPERRSVRAHYPLKRGS